VQLARDAQALGLLCRERRPCRFVPRVLQSIEHGVERSGHGLTLCAPGIYTRQPPARPVGVDRAHHLREPEEGGQHPPQEQEIQADQHDEACQEQRKLFDLDRRVDLDRGEGQQQKREQENRAVHRENPPQQ
jgi:hypothetical protein